MGRDERARQKALERKKRRREEKLSLIAESGGVGVGLAALGLPGALGGTHLGHRLEAIAARSSYQAAVGGAGLRARKALIRAARDFPIHECVARADMEERGLSPLLITRVQPNGNLVFATFLVDLYCLGVKDAFCNADVSVHAYERALKPETLAGGTPRILPPILLHQIVYGSIDYAASLGFEPHRDFELASCLLDPRSRIPPNPDLEFGKEGKPLFISGPKDNVSWVLRTLERNAGQGKFDFLVGGPTGG